VGLPFPSDGMSEVNIMPLGRLDSLSSVRSKGTMPKKGGTPRPIGEHLLTLREAADVLRLHPRTVREYASRGEIEGRVIGGRWRFRRVDLDAFFENAPREWDFRGRDADGD
jgi:excisionase family DNA binding protein